MNAVLEVQRKTGLKNTLLHRRILRLKDTAEKREALIGELTAATEEPPTNKKLEVSKWLKYLRC